MVALIRTIFLKRFESSLAAFAGSCLDLSAEGPRAGSTSTPRSTLNKKPASDWRAANEPTLKKIHDPYRPTLEEVWHEEDLTEEELNELEYNLVGGDYNLER